VGGVAGREIAEAQLREHGGSGEAYVIEFLSSGAPVRAT
jgi:hypothetical protein